MVSSLFCPVSQQTLDAIVDLAEDLEQDATVLSEGPKRFMFSHCGRASRRASLLQACNVCDNIPHSPNTYCHQDLREIRLPNVCVVVCPHVLSEHVHPLMPFFERCCWRSRGCMPPQPTQSFPTSAVVTVPSAHLRVVRLRRLRFPLPVAPRTCACRGHLDLLGNYRPACATSGVLASRVLPLERAVTRVCQEIGARVACNARLADMNTHVPVSDYECIAIVANGRWQFPVPANRQGRH